VNLFCQLQPQNNLSFLPQIACKVQHNMHWRTDSYDFLTGKVSEMQYMYKCFKIYAKDFHGVEFRNILIE
jgi:hypothetical protein